VTTVAEEPMTLGEIGRRINDLFAEVRGLRAELVRADVYTANRAADEARFKVIEAEQVTQRSDRTAMRRLVYGAFLSAAGSIVILILTLALQRK
jgi:hypothetical protein